MLDFTADNSVGRDVFRLLLIYLFIWEQLQDMSLDFEMCSFCLT